MKIHEVCTLCLKACKQPYEEWSDTEPELKFCKNFDAPRSKLPVETLEEFIADMRQQTLLAKDTAQEGQVNKFNQYLIELRKVYIPCSKCGSMIAPDELYRILEEQPVCQRCVEAT
jgi:formylmethanofuran dehydrogenase subunit E